MKYLLDTHTLLWALFSPAKIPVSTRKAILNLDHSVFVSHISLFEISLKYSIGKLSLTKQTPDQLPQAIREAGFDFLQDSPEVFAGFHRLPILKHFDPFDRMLIWQAIAGGLTMISKDRMFDRYTQHGLRLLW